MKTIVYILTIFLFACGQRVERTKLTRNITYPNPYILDSLVSTNKTYKSSKMQVPINDVIYNGPITDTINLIKYDRYANYLDIQDYLHISIVSTDLKLYISKRQLLTIDLEEFSAPPPPIVKEDDEFDSIATAKTLEIWEKRPRNYIQTIPVFIYNPSKDTAYLDLQDGRVKMLQEAKDENGVWKPIEFWEYSWCGNSYNSERLLPNSVAVVKVFKYDGDFKTELRLKLKIDDHIYYSDNYKGKIYKSQFDLPSNIRENYLVKLISDKEYMDKIFLND